MDGENNGKPYFFMDDLGIPLFLETPICITFRWRLSSSTPEKTTPSKLPRESSWLIHGYSTYPYDVVTTLQKEALVRDYCIYSNPFRSMRCYVEQPRTTIIMNI